jgi:hypothetical protein
MDQNGTSATIPIIYKTISTTATTTGELSIVIAVVAEGTSYE